MKKFNRVLAMLLALVTVLAILPISAFADKWLSVKTEKTTEENVTSTDITVSVDPKALLSYLKDGDIKGLLKGVSASGSLGDIMTKEELLAIIPEEQIIDLIKSIIADIDAKELLACLDADKLLACVDTEGLKSLLEDMNLKSYIKDINVVVKYINESDLEKAVAYINTQTLINKYSAELTNLVMGLDADTLVDLIDDESAIALFTEDELIDMALNGVVFNASALKEKLQAKLQNGDVTAKQIVACIVDYTAAVKAIGVENVVDAIPGGYMTLVDYVEDYKGFVTAFDVKGIAKNIIKNREITQLIDAVALIKAINVRAFVSKVDVKQLVKVVYESGVLQELIGMLDFDTYLVKLFNIYGSLSSTITEIKVDGATITTRNEDFGMTKLNPAGLLDAITNLVPTLTELANIDEDGKLFSASFEISYLDGNVEKTKVINFTFVLESGAELVRAAAAKLSVLVNKIGTVGLSNGQLVANINIPSEFASVLRIALEKMADSQDPAMNTLKDKVLAVYTAYPDDFIAFAEGLTLEEVVAVLDAVDPALFGRVYSKALASRYAQVLLSYVEKVTGYDFSDNLEAQNLINTLANIPTFEAFVEKLEEVTGKEITDRLPAKVNGALDHTVYDVINKLAEVAGYDFDLQALLTNAADFDDPFAYLYTAVINKVENAGAVYSFVKTNAIKVADRLLASKYGAVVADNCLMDFYAGNSTFVFAKSVTFDAKVVLEKGIKKALGFVADRVAVVGNREDKIANLVDEALDMLLANGSYVTTGFNVTVNVKNVYRATFQNENGGVIIDTLLPVGIDLSKMVNVYENVEGFDGWFDVATGELITKMPAKDIIVKANIKGEEPEVQYVIEVIPTIDGKVIDGKVTINVLKGAFVGNYITELNNAADALRPAVTNETDKLLGYIYAAEAWGDVLDTVITDEVTTVYVNYVLDKTTGASIKIEGCEGNFTIVFEDGACKVIFDNSWDAAMSFAMNTEFLAQLNAMGLNLVFTTADGAAQTVTLSNAMLKQLVDAAGTCEVVALNYAPATPDANSGAQSYEFTFEFGNADGRIPAEIDTFVDKGVEITLPFANTLNETNAKTFVYVDGEEVTVDAANGLVTFYAPHFSTITVVNKYMLTVDTNNTYLNDGTTISGSIATITTSIEGWYEENEQIKVTVQETNALEGYEYDVTKVNGVVVPAQANEITITMPAAAATVQHFAKLAEYTVNYYVNGECIGNYTYNKTAASDVNAIVDTILDEGDKLLTSDLLADGWFWFDQDNLASKLGNEVINLYRVNDTVTTITFNFYVGTVEGTADYSIENVALTNWVAALANLKFTIDSELPGYIWTVAGTDKALTALTLEDLLASNGTINFVGTSDNYVYNIINDGNVNVLQGAKAGETVTFTVNDKNGFTSIVIIKTAYGAFIVAQVNNGTYTFTMPAADVKISVTYTAIAVQHGTIVVEIEAGKVLNGISATDLTKIAQAPAGLTLAGIERKADGTLVLTYVYAKTGAQVDEQAFINAVLNNYTTKATYNATWIVNGVSYNSAAAAESAQLPEGAKIVGWTEMAPNVYAAIIEYTAPAGVSAWLIVCIVLAILLLIALIVLVYVLHVTEKIAASWLTKVCAAIVGGFFAFCMWMANVALKVLNFVGIKKEDVIEELPAETVEDVPAVIIDTEAADEEATEEVVEEATEEVAEEATEEVAEEATEEVAEEATEEVAEEATEEVAEEATEEVAEEATEEVVEEATEEVTEEATEEVAEEATEEVVEEATEEVVEEATEEVAEEATEEVAEEATEEVVEEATEEVAEEATEEVVEEATEEVAEEVTEEENKDE